MSEENKGIKADNSQKNDTSTYRSIFKATSLFGGVQVYQILIGILRSKFIAMILGPAGMGISGLYTSATAMIKSLSSMGLQSSAVRDVSEANGTSDQHRINVTITTLRKLVWFTGLLGMAIVLFGSPLLSKSTFDSYEYIIPFMILSVTLLVDQLTVGQYVILQGTRRLKYLARSSAIGSTLGLLVTIPLYYFMGVDGIVPALVIVSFVSYFLAIYFARKVPYQKVSMTLKEAVKNGCVMLKMGIAMSVNGMLTSAVAYILRIFIMHQGGTADVGLFTAGYAILGTYVGMVFSAISTDYYPRLAAVNQDNTRCRVLINQEGEVGTLILAPCLILCILFMPLIIRILYTGEFAEASDYVFWASLGMMFKMASWVIAFIFIAKSAMKTFLLNEISVNVYGLIVSVAGYYLWGLKGLGIAFTVKLALYAIQVFFVTNVKYNYKPSLGFIKVFALQSLLVCFAIAVVVMTKGVYTWVFGIILAVTSAVYSLYGLNKRMHLSDVIKSKLAK